MALTVYQSPDQNLDFFLSSITVALDHYLQYYEDFIKLGDFNKSEDNPEMQSFLSQQDYKNIIK